MTVMRDRDRDRAMMAVLATFLVAMLIVMAAAEPVKVRPDSLLLHPRFRDPLGVLK